MTQLNHILTSKKILQLHEEKNQMNKNGFHLTLEL